MKYIEYLKKKLALIVHVIAENVSASIRANRELEVALKKFEVYSMFRHRGPIFNVIYSYLIVITVERYMLKSHKLRSGVAREQLFIDSSDHSINPSFSDHRF